MEEHLRDFLATNAPQLEVVSIQCRSTLCEVQALGTGAYGAQQWKNTVAAMRQQSWWTFSGDSSASSEQDGHSVIFSILHRA